MLLRALLGLLGLCAVAWALSSHKRRFPWRIVAIGIALQAALGAAVLGTAAGRSVFEGVASFFRRLIGFTDNGAQFVFGPLANPEKLAAVFGPDWGFIFAFAGTGLLAIVGFAALMSVLYHIGIMQLVVWFMARAMSLTLGVSGAEAMSVAADVFVGMTEAPLVVKPYLPRMTLSELNALMTAGFSTIAGSVLAVYMGILGPELAPHLLTASIMSAPAAFVVAKILVPETQATETSRNFALRIERPCSNVIEAGVVGASEGMKLYLNVIAMLIAFNMLVAVVDWPLEHLGRQLALDGGLSLSRLFGWLFAPVAWLMGVEGWHDSQVVGGLLGTKISLNEFVAYKQMSAHLAGSAAPFEHARSAAIATYALCGFANFASVGIEIGGLTPLAPARSADISRLAFRAMLGGALATCMAATIAGAFLDP